MHAGHCIIALCEVAILVEQTQLLISWEPDVDRLLDVHPPDPFRAVDDKRTIALLARAQSFFSALAVSDVLDHCETIKWIAAFTSNHHCGDIKPRERSVFFDKAFLDSITRDLASNELLHEFTSPPDIVCMTDVNNAAPEEFVGRVSQSLAKRLVHAAQTVIKIDYSHSNRCFLKSETKPTLSHPRLLVTVGQRRGG